MAHYKASFVSIVCIFSFDIMLYCHNHKLFLKNSNISHYLRAEVSEPTYIIEKSLDCLVIPL